MTYMTIRATVRQGKVELLDDITLPEDATLLVTVLDDVILEQYTLGDHLIAGLEDVLAGRTVEVTGAQELADYLDAVLGQA
jgi:hypothetical protein